MILLTVTKQDNGFKTTKAATLVMKSVTVPHSLPSGVESKFESLGNFPPGARQDPPLAGALLRRQQVGSAASRVPQRHSALLCVPPHCSICIV